MCGNLKIQNDRNRRVFAMHTHFLVSHDQADVRDLNVLCVSGKKLNVCHLCIGSKLLNTLRGSMLCESVFACTVEIVWTIGKEPYSRL